MSAGTIIACACKCIVMGKQSNLGPIDPQFGGIPAHGILEEFERIKSDVLKNPKTIVYWKEILGKYSPTLIGECDKAVKWAVSMVTEWLKGNMFSDDPDKDKKVKSIVDFLGSHTETLFHSRHLHMKELENIGLKIVEMEGDQELQDKILSVHHSTTISITQTKATKIMENNIGKAFIQSF